MQPPTKPSNQVSSQKQAEHQQRDQRISHLATPEGWSAAEAEIFDLTERISSMQVQLDDKELRTRKGERWYSSCLYHMRLARNAQCELKWLMSRAADLRAQADRREANRLKLEMRKLDIENEAQTRKEAKRLKLEMRKLDIENAARARANKAETKVRQAQLNMLGWTKKAMLQTAAERKQAEDEHRQKKLELLSSQLAQDRADLDALKTHLKRKYGRDWTHIEYIEAGLMRCIYEDNLHVFSPEVQALAVARGIVQKRETP